MTGLLANTLANDIEEWLFPFGLLFGLPITFAVVSIVGFLLDIRRQKPTPPFGESRRDRRH
jgi:hypothetical protein